MLIYQLYNLLQENCDCPSDGDFCEAFNDTVQSQFLAGGQSFVNYQTTLKFFGTMGLCTYDGTPKASLLASFDAAKCEVVPSSAVVIQIMWYTILWLFIICIL